MRFLHVFQHFPISDMLRALQLLEPWRRSQVAKAADCKSAIIGSNPIGAFFQATPGGGWPFLFIEGFVVIRVHPTEAYLESED